MNQAWPDLPYPAWKDTCATLQLWTQVVGKIRLVQSPWVNHSWHVPLYVTARGLTTSPIRDVTRVFEIDFDFIDHQLVIRTDDGSSRVMPLVPQTVADFYAKVLALLAELGIEVSINTMPNEIADCVAFEHDREHRSYDAEYAHRFWRTLLQSDRVMKEFRARFKGKCSPVHFFWGSFDLAMTRFSGRRAPDHPGGVPHLPDWVAREAYSHEVSSCGFWPGNDALPYPAFYCYAYPEPPGFDKAGVRPASAFYHADLHEFILPYDEVRKAISPDAALLEFLQSSYEAAADLAKWDRAALE